MVGARLLDRLGLGTLGEAGIAKPRREAVAVLLRGGERLLQPRPFRLYVDDGEKVHRVWATEARIANGTHHGGVELVESASLDSGEIVVQAVTGKSLLRLAWSWFATLFKLRSRDATLTEFHGRRLTIEAHPQQPISIDGEIAAKTPVTVGVARAAVTVAAPREELAEAA